jgi:hypothetical protein
MTGPNDARSSGDGEPAGDAALDAALVGDALLGDARASTTGALLDGAALDGNELGNSLGDAACSGDAALEICALALGVLVAE